MTVLDKTPQNSKRRAAKLRIIGIVVPGLGIAGAGLIYWLGSRSQDLNNDPAMLGYNRAETRQMGLLYGKSGLLMDDWLNDLKQPGVQALIILAFSAVIAFVCLYFARLLEQDDDNGPRGSTTHNSS